MEIRLTKTGPNGQPHAEILVPPNASFDDLVRAQKILYTDGLQIIGRKACNTCFSGVQWNIREQFENVIQVD